MTQLLLVLAVALTVGLIVFGITVLLGGDDPGLRPAEPDGRSRPLPGYRPLGEADLQRIRFDTALRGYRMADVDAAVRRVAYDIGYKDELIRVLQAEVEALRDGRFPDAEVLRRAREAAVTPPAAPARDTDPAQVSETEADETEADETEAEVGQPETEADSAAEPATPRQVAGGQSDTAATGPR